MAGSERVLLVVGIVFFFLWFTVQRRKEGFVSIPAPYMDSWNWDIRGIGNNRDPNRVQTSGMDVLFPVYDYIPSAAYAVSYEPISNWYYDSVTYGPISKPWGPSSRDVLVRF